MKFFSLFFFFLFFSFFSFATEQNSFPKNFGYNFSGRKKASTGENAFFGASFLYLLPKEKGLDFVSEMPTSSPFSPTKFICPDFDHKPAFKVFFGTYFDSFDDWCVSVEYFRLHMRQRKSTTPSENQKLVSTWLIQSVSDIFFASGNWRLNEDLFTIQFSRLYFSGKKLILSPSLGLQGGWIDQHYHAIYKIPDHNGFSINALKSHLLGPHFGLGFDWLFDKQGHFRFFSSFSTTLFLQFFRGYLKEFEITRPENLDYFIKNHKPYSLTPFFDAFLGLSYGTCFARDFHFSALLGYEFQFLGKQNRMRSLRDSFVKNTSEKPEDLTLHGFTASLQLGF